MTVVSADIMFIKPVGSIFNVHLLKQANYSGYLQTYELENAVNKMTF